MTTKCPKVFTNIKSALSSQTITYKKSQQRYSLDNIISEPRVSSFKKSVSVSNLSKLLGSSQRISVSVPRLVYDLVKQNNPASKLHTQNYTTIMPTTRSASIESICKNIVYLFNLYI